MAALIYILLCLIWGSTWIMIKIGLEDSPPITSAALRFILAVTILIIICKIKKAEFPTGTKAWLSRAYPGLYMYGAGYGLVYLAEKYISSSLTSVLFASYPLFVAIISVMMIKGERISLIAAIGLLLGFSGIILISYNSFTISGDIFLGSLLCLTSAFLGAYGMIIHKKKFANEDIYASVTIQMGFGGLPLIFLALILENPMDFEPTLKSIGSLVYLASMGSVVAFIGYYWLLKNTRAVVVSLIAFITPLVAIFIGVGLFDEVLTSETIMGTGLILGGVFMATRK